MHAILTYLEETYHPLAVILYGSYADGTNNDHSDFDALVITRNCEQQHDVSCVSNIQLDVFVYPETFFQQAYNCDDFIQIADGRILTDSTGTAQALMDNVADYISQLPMKSPEEAREDAVWCRKMLERTHRGDAESFYRWHWVLCDSLEIFCSLKQHRYTGPKKSLRWMERTYPESYTLYRTALTSFTPAALKDWIDCLEQA